MYMFAKSVIVQYWAGQEANISQQPFDAGLNTSSVLIILNLNKPKAAVHFY